MFFERIQNTVPAKGGFYNVIKKTYQSNLYNGWKLHFSIRDQDVKEAYDIIGPILEDHFDFFKLLDIDKYDPTRKIVDARTQESCLDNRFENCNQIVIYLTERNGKPTVSIKVLEETMQLIQDKLTQKHIQLGIISPSDAQIKYEGFSLRNDGMRELNEQSYLSSLEAGNNYNPFNFINPYESLLATATANFSPKQHFMNFPLINPEKFY